METLIKKRQQYFPKCLYHAYQTPIEVKIAKDQYYNSEYLDLYNNVCQIGHSNSRIANVISQEYNQLNINTRFLNQNLTNYAEKLAQYVPHHKSYKFLFVNSGSEANDLALRIGLMKHPHKKIMSMEYSYHGTTYLCDKVSHLYSTGVIKSQTDNDQVVFIPRNALDRMITNLPQAGTLIIETLQGVGGNFNFDTTFLQKSFEHAKLNNVITICDEVQTGFGRTGHTFWAFQYYGLEPDIITCGKPIANGYPMGCVIVREDLADILGNFYFNTFGGNSVACHVAQIVLEEIENQRLMENCKVLGDYLIQQLTTMPCVEKVYGRGLYVGIQLHHNIDAPKIVEQLKDNKILIGIGANHILRIKPPLVVNKENIDTFLSILHKLLESWVINTPISVRSGEFSRMKTIEYNDYANAFYNNHNTNILPFHTPYKYKFDVNEKSTKHYLKIMFNSDCIYDMTFTSTQNLQIIDIEITDGEHTILTLTKNNGVFTSGDELFMLILAYYLNDNTPFPFACAQYKITYNGSGTITYKCQQGYLREKTRKRYVKHIGKIQIGSIIYSYGLCRQKFTI